MTTPNGEVSEILRAFNDSETFADLVHEDAVLEFPYGPSLGIPATISGPGVARDHLEQVRKSGLTLADAQIRPLADNAFLVEQRGVYQINGASVDIPIVTIVRIDGGRITQLREYWDTAALASAMATAAH